MQKMNLTQKILKAHLVKGQMTAGEEIAIKIDQTLTQDSTGTMAYLQFEAMGIDKVKTERSVAYIDHNMLQTGFENADDHAYIQSVALKYGIYVSRPGNGICHQVHLERFAVPTKTLLGSDSHTPTCGGMGMIAIGAGGLDVAVAMGGGAINLTMPKVVNVELRGRLRNNVSAKDIILRVLQLLTVKGGVNKAIEYSGEALKTLSVPERATITNMGAELGATFSIFPSDSVTQKFLKAQNREKDFIPLCADENAEYDEKIIINLDELVPLTACPHSPDNVKTVSELGKMKIDQVCIGSCTNSSYLDMMRTASILRGKTIAPNVSLTISPGSKQVLTALALNGALADMINAGARVLECSCGPCIGMGQSPKNNAVSLRTFNRNFYARSGTDSANVYLVSPETAAFSAINGYLTDPTDEKKIQEIEIPESFLINDNLILNPNDFKNIEVERGINIKPFPKAEKVKNEMEHFALIKLGDNITTDHIMPSNSKLLPFRSNIPYLSNFCLAPVDTTFSERATKNEGGFIIAGQNYGQGSSREHAALVPLYLKVKAVIAKSFARIHKDNLINNGILPLCFKQTADYDNVDQMDALKIENIHTLIIEGKDLLVKNLTKNTEFYVTLDLSKRLREIILAGGVLAFLSKNK